MMPTLKVQSLKKGRLVRTCAVLVVLLLLAILPGARPAHALDPFYVITTADEHDLFPGDGQCVSNLTSICTLRAAVEEVNVSGSRNIILPEGTFLLTLGYLAITGTPTITGAGAGRTILDGNGTNRVFDI